MGMMEKFKMAAEVKKKADAMNMELTAAEIKALDPSGLAQVTVSGLGAPLRVIVSPELAKKVPFLISPLATFSSFRLSLQSASEISLAVTQASIKAHSIAAKQMSEKISKIYSDAGLPLPNGGGPN
jgi:hypothetical protein